MNETKKKPLKTCPDCNDKCHARRSKCDCGFVFYEKKDRNRVIKDWKTLKKGDVVRSVHGNGPYWINPNTQEKIYMGSYGKFVVQEIQKDYIVATESTKSKYKNYSQGGHHILYMGNNKRSELCDNLYRCPHKLIGVSLKGKGESK